MEHRYNKRFSSDHKTLIFKNGMPVAIGRIHNFSRGGMFIKTDVHLVEVNQSLDIELIARGGNRSSASCAERRLCKTLVMHKANSGIGLMLREDCADTQKNFTDFFAEEFERYQGLANLLQSSSTANTKQSITEKAEVAAINENHSFP